MTIDRTITHRLITIETKLDRVETKLDRLLSMLDPDGPDQTAMHHDLEAILSSIGQAVLTPAAREVKG
ncbi:hypothetical protein VH570_16660 [Sphingobium sp. HT1-2]|jgi:hypothetical protein|uniref:hypothetical protein n=1 Tax=Sphingobium TaxID=165695 RepID=UPI000F7E0100|nr:hypothetical protein [Sphingobium yanoikuyae]RSU73195.1 hypothetical protein BRX37_16715 [Sphingomonas sp. S-NIH.Pt3_0716]